MSGTGPGASLSTRFRHTVRSPAPQQRFGIIAPDLERGEGREAEGRGLHAVFDGLNPERVISAVLSTGTARYALEKATRYALDHKLV